MDLSWSHGQSTEEQGYTYIIAHGCPATSLDPIQGLRPVQYRRNCCLSHAFLVLALGVSKVMSDAAHEAGLGLAGCQAIYGAESQQW